MTMESTGADAPPADLERRDGHREKTHAVEPARRGPGIPEPRSGPRLPGGAARRGRGELAALVAADCLAATAAALLAGGGTRAAVLDLAPVVLTLIALHQQGGLYRCGPHRTALGELPALLWRAALAWSAATTVVAAVRPEPTLGWTRLASLVAVHVVLAALLRGALYAGRRRRQRHHPRSALVVGPESAGHRVAAVLHEHPEYGMWPVGLVVPPSAAQALTPPGVHGSGLPLPVLTAAEDVTRAVIQNAVCDAVLTRPAQADPDTAALVRLFRTLGCTVWVVDGETVPGAVAWRTAETGHVWGFPCARLDPPPRRSAARVAKRGLDLVVAALALVVSAPVLAACGLAVRCSDGPGVLFRQERVGAHGRPFVMLKFRTLRPANAHESATRWNVAHDRRMSGVGRFLRRTSLDELPQLWNVLRGDMSLVGPRPERPYFVQQFSTAHPGYAARDRMPVGITGLAQIHGLRGDTSIEDRARFDNHYIETWSFWQDVQILLRTAGSVFRLGGS